MDSFDKGWQTSLVLLAGFIFGAPFLFGSCWLLTWFFKPGYKEVAMLNGYGSATPFVAGAIAISSLMIFSFIYSSLHQHDS